MIDQRYPYHVISNVDCFGVDYHKSTLPRVEEDFATLDEAVQFLHQGGEVQQFIRGKYRRVETVHPGGARALTA